ncbi:hypothetical protein GBSCOH1_1939 [Streptococcus agalactiae COH1]|nr:hypothetical protein GBSCOH1_1939 [Streptococcus agalactiae COH1]
MEKKKADKCSPMDHQFSASYHIDLYFGNKLRFSISLDSSLANFSDTKASLIG